MSPRKYVPLLVGVLLLAALLLVPLSRSSSPSNQGNPVAGSVVQPSSSETHPDRLAEIHVNVSLPEDQFRLLQQANQRFMMKYPHIQVKLTNEEELRSAYGLWKRQSQQGAAADVMLLDNGFVKPFAVQGYLKAVDRLVTGDATADQMAGLLEPLKWNGYLWGKPKDVSPYLVVWSRALLEKAGLQEPPGDWTAYQQAAAALIGIDSEINILNWSGGDYIQQLGWIARFQPEQSNLINLDPPNDSQSEQLLWLQSMEAHISRLDTASVPEWKKAFREGKLLAAILPWHVYRELGTAVQKGLIVDKEHLNFSWLNGRSFVISSGSAAEEEAMLWIGEMTDIHHQRTTYERFGRLPVSASLYASGVGSISDQSEAPPAWLKKVLEEKQPDDQLPHADPDWPDKWLQLEGQWRQFSEDGLHLDAFVESLRNRDAG
ncbi:extracellular solute-binding protein [Paenibacillus sp. N4]|uniref:extracellular solute-binding protein n=1 Tax=Paenibacillus vietnamensis TaxID=2590547 RepID=UPI001CD10035|nr:extracellular solute-binding protein [Paenibacillus vietnamensis]MCA0753809.1 extracellular solute-binding protein [Paenibacillus vietnamensis]